MSYSMSDLLQLVVSEGSSDLHVRVGVPPTIRVHGILHRVEGPALTPEDTEQLMRSITSDDHIQHVRESGGADFGFAFGAGGERDTQMHVVESADDLSADRALADAGRAADDDHLAFLDLL